MPKKWFRFPNGKIITIKEALSGKNEIANKFYPIPYLEAIAEDRPWKGRVSVTMAQGGLRETWLKFNTDYIVNTDGEYYRMLGIGVHTNFEHDAKKVGDYTYEAEQFVNYEGITGRYDLLIHYKKSNVLIDYKTTASNHMKKVLGFGKIGVEPDLNENGEQQFYKRDCKSGRKGDIKVKPVYGFDKELQQLDRYAYQLNMYRVALQATGKIINEMKIFFIIRDASTQTAIRNGFTENTMYIDIPYIDDKIILEYFQSRQKKILTAMKRSEKLRKIGLPNREFLSAAKIEGLIPEPCTAEECWNGHKCKYFCNQKECCKIIGDNKYLGKEENNETKTD